LSDSQRRAGAPGSGGAAEASLAVLGLGPGADEEEIRTAWRRLARRLHPDGSGDPATAARFARVARAYKVLKALPAAAAPASGAAAPYRRVLEAGDDLFALGRILAEDADPGAREAATRRLGLTGRTAAYVFLRRALYDADEGVAKAAVRAVALLGTRQAAGEVAALYSRSGLELRRHIVETAAATPEPLFLPVLRAARAEADPVLRLRAARVLSLLEKLSPSGGLPTEPPRS
jgi:HEAT repeat protein